MNKQIVILFCLDVEKLFLSFYLNFWRFHPHRSIVVRIFVVLFLSSLEKCWLILTVFKTNQPNYDSDTFRSYKNRNGSIIEKNSHDFFLKSNFPREKFWKIFELDGGGANQILPVTHRHFFPSPQRDVTQLAKLYTNDSAWIRVQKGFSSVRWFYSFFLPLGINWDKSRTNHQCICFPANIFVFRFTSKGEESKRESKWSFSSVFIRSDFIVMTFCSAFLTIFFRRCYEKSTSSSNRTVCVRISMSSAVWLDRLLWNRWISQKAMVCP